MSCARSLLRVLHVAPVAHLQSVKCVPKSRVCGGLIGPPIRADLTAPDETRVRKVRIESLGKHKSRERHSWLATD
jgi:hypothetical protein